ncbi:MAG: class I SAM-dependent methyltransferase, partial [Alphaproteobacteria bacterium]
GGPSRYFAGERGAHVTGIDLTDEYVRAAASLSRMVGLGDRTEYRTGSALDLPFDAGTFEGAYMLHVGMNIADKAALFRGVRRVIAPGGVFAVYDVMRIGDGDLTFPVPWATQPSTSFLDTTDTYRRLLRAGGFDVLHERVRRGFAIEFFRRMRERMAASGPSPLGLHVVMGPTAPQKVANMVANIAEGRIAPVEMIARAV